MPLREYKPGTAFPGHLGRTIAESTPAWPAPEREGWNSERTVHHFDDTGLDNWAAMARRWIHRT
jgi:arylsulfatase